MDQQDRKQLMQDLAAKIARHIRHEQKLQGPLARNPDNHDMVTSLVLVLIDQSGAKLSQQEIGALCFSVTKLLFEPPAPQDPAVLDTRVIRWQEGGSMEQQAPSGYPTSLLETRNLKLETPSRDRLLDELSARLARHISHRLGVAAPLPRDEDTYAQVR